MKNIFHLVLYMEYTSYKKFVKLLFKFLKINYFQIQVQPNWVSSDENNLPFFLA